MRKFISALLVLCVCLSVCSVSVFGLDSTFDYDDCMDISMNGKKESNLIYLEPDFYWLFNKATNYTVIKQDDVITVKNISDVPDVLLTIELEPLRYSEDVRVDLSDAQEISGVSKNDFIPLYKGASQLFKLNDMVSFSPIDRKSSMTSLDGYKVLKSGESVTFTLPPSKYDVIWAIGVNYFESDDIKNALTHISWVHVPGVKVFSRFKDITATDYYYYPVLWAVDNKITDGTSDTTFSPENTCTNAEILTFMWRANGSVKSGKDISKYPDLASRGIKESDYYCEAYKWASDKGMIGDIANSGYVYFPKPSDYCNRNSVVSFLFTDLLLNKKASGEFFDMNSYDYPSDFEDVPKSGIDAIIVNWAVENGITDGTSDTTFSPYATCTRGQIVTFLYRAYANK